MINKRLKKQSGFTLIEMAIVIIIAGIMFSFLGSALISYLKTAKIQATEQRIEAINKALAEYLSINRRYPCVARTNVTPDTANFGRELDVPCNGGAVAGTINAGNVRIGSVPTRTLNLPDEFSVDGWNQRFTYAVTKLQATSNPPNGTFFTNDGGLIRISDSSGTPFYNKAHYVLLSHGATKEGSFSLNGVIASNCSATALDRENCNGDDEFLTTLLNSEANTPNFYDDYFYYQGQTMPAFDPIPPGAVMAFDLMACPAGWSDYTNAQSRFVVGIGPNIATTSYNLATLSPTPTSPTQVDNLGDVGLKDDNTMTPPYVALLYCEKD